MDTVIINTASAHNEPSKFQLAEVKAEVKNEASSIKGKTVSMSKEEVWAVAESLEKHMDILRIGIGFSNSESANGIVVTVTNKDTNEIIRQIPSEALLKLQEKMEELTGILFSKLV